MKKYIISLCGIFIVSSIFFLLNKDSWIYKDNPTTARVDMLFLKVWKKKELSILFV